MKKLIFIIFFSGLLIFSGAVFTEEQNRGNGFYNYYNSDGSLDWDTFYKKWNDVPDSYFIYLHYFTHSAFDKKVLVKTVGGLLAILDETRRNDIIFKCEDIHSSLEIIFSPWSYTNAKDTGHIPLGQKRYNYRDAIERWNFMLDNME